MVWVPNSAGDFAWQVSSISATRPAANMGTSVTPGNNTKGSYSAAILTSANVARDVFGLLVNINSGSTAAAARDILVDIGVDPAGGTSFSVLVPDLLGSCASTWLLGGGVWYYFPIWIKAGSSLAARASVNNGTVGTVRVALTAFGSPRDRRMTRVGTKVTAYGITAASSSGTAVTAGTTAEGAWTQLAASTSHANWWWQLGMGCNDGTMSALAYAIELGLGDATNKRVVIPDNLVITDGAENLTKWLAFGEGVSPSGVGVYGRIQCSGAADAALSLAAYGVSG